MNLYTRVGEKFYGYFECARFSVDIQQTTTYDKNVAINISFSYHNGDPYRGGSLQISPEIAQWLGTALIAAAEGQLKQKGRSIDVHNDTQITEPKKFGTAKIVKVTLTDPK
jgi:hypothetical protein